MSPPFSRPSNPRRLVPAGAVLLAVAAVAAYHNTFHVPFLFDDTPSIGDNTTIRHLWPIWQVLVPPSGYGVTVSGRPILNLSLALNYAVSGLHVWSYHALNLLIHLLAGLTLFGIVRRTLCRYRSADFGSRISEAGDRRPGPESFTEREATWLGFTVALLWTLHPLQTEAVTYIIQRTKSLMGLFFLLTFYGFIRSTQSSRPWRWRVFTVAACLLGVGTKEVTATAPVLVLLYDRAFVAGSFREAWRRRRWLHLALAATWVPLLGLVASTGWNRGGTAGFDVGISAWGYWFTQLEAVARYLKQTVWPHPLVFEYGTFYARLADAAPYALIVVPLAAATLIALWRWPVWGFLGGWFFAILAPTSLVPGTIQMIVEHRMYLPLAALIAGAVVGLHCLLRKIPGLQVHGPRVPGPRDDTIKGPPVRSAGEPEDVRCGGFRLFPSFPGALALLLAVPFGLLTFQRNATYHSDLALWQDTVNKTPGSAIAQSGIGTALYSRGHLRAALFHYLVSNALNPRMPTTHFNLGLTLLQSGHPVPAKAEFIETLRLNPLFYPADYHLGLTLVLLGQPQKALPYFARTVKLMPEMAEAQYEWGVALAKLDRAAEAIPHYEAAMRLKPDYIEAACDLGVALFQQNRLPEAEAALRRALQINPDNADAHFDLGLALARIGRPDEALAQYAEAARLNPNGVEIQLNLGVALAQAGRIAEALPHLERAAQLRPDLATVRCNLGIALAEAGRLPEAVAQYHAALRLLPDYAGAHYNLGNALLQLHRVPEAEREFEAALRIDPGFAAAREVLDRLQSAPAGP